MSSHIVHIALNTYSIAYKLFETIPLQWNAKQKRLIHISSHSKLRTWYFGMIVVMIYVCGNVFIVANQFFSGKDDQKSKIKLVNLIVVVCMVVFGVLGVGIALSFIVYGKDGTFGFNGLDELRRQIQKDLKVSKSSGKTGGNLKIVAAMINCLSPSLAFMPIIMTMGGVTFNMDTLYYISKYILPPNASASLRMTAFFLRLVLGLICVSELCRLFLTLLLFFIGGLLLNLDVLNLIEEAAAKDGRNHAHELSLSKIDYQIKMHTRLLILHLYYRPIQEAGTLGLMILGLAVGVLTNYLTVTAFDILPLSIYWVCPSGSALIPTVIHFTIPFAINVNDISCRLMQVWKMDCPGHKGALYMRKKIRSVRSLKLYVGLFGNNLFYLQRSTKTTFYSVIITHTIDLLFAIPKNSLKN